MISYKLLLALDPSVVKSIIVDNIILSDALPRDIRDFIKRLFYELMRNDGCIYLYRCTCKKEADRYYNAYLLRQEYYESLKDSIFKLYKSHEGFRKRYYKAIPELRKFEKHRFSEACILDESSIVQKATIIYKFERLIVKVMQIIFDLAFCNSQVSRSNWKICFMNCPCIFSDEACSKLEYKYSDKQNCNICVKSILETISNCSHSNVNTYIGTNISIDCLNDIIKRICQNSNYERCGEDLHIYLTPFCEVSGTYFNHACRYACSLDHGESIKCLWVITFGKCKNGDSICFPSSNKKTKCNILFVCGNVTTPIIRDSKNNISICFGIIYLCQ